MEGSGLIGLWSLGFACLGIEGFRTFSVQGFGGVRVLVCRGLRFLFWAFEVRGFKVLGRMEILHGMLAHSPAC